MREGLGQRRRSRGARRLAGVEKSVAIRILNREDLRPGQFGLSGRVAQDFAGFLASFWGASPSLCYCFFRTGKRARWVQSSIHLSKDATIVTCVLESWAQPNFLVWYDFKLKQPICSRWNLTPSNILKIKAPHHQIIKRTNGVALFYIVWLHGQK